MNNEYTEKVISAVEKARREVRSAESTFASEGRRIERMANYTSINIYNMSKAVEIVAEVKKTTDELYTSYETIVRTLDKICRPYLSLGISGEAIKKVADLMQEINSESSSLSSNVTGTFNSSSIGDLRTERYMASLEARTIEKFWMAQYDMTPEAEEEKRKKEAELAERRKKLAEQAERAKERKKREAESKQRQAELKAAEEKKILEANSIAKSHMDDIDAECNKKIIAYENELKSFIEEQQIKYQAQINSKVEELQSTIQELQDKAHQLGFFKKYEKKSINSEITRLQTRIIKFQDPSIISTEIASMLEQANQAVNKYKQEIEMYMSKRFSDYNTTSKKSRKKVLMYIENTEVSQEPIPEPASFEEVFK